jgi:hypothetical protein
VPADPSEPTQTSEAVAPDDDRDRRQSERDADLDRDRGSDLDADEQIVWFDPDALAIASAIEIGSHALEIAVLRSGPDPDRLAAAIAAPGLSLARMPGWPGAGPSGQGWGSRLDALIGPIRPGFVGLIGAERRGAGRTSWLAQIADGLALREGEVLTPVICMVEDQPRIWRARSLGRWAGIDPRSFLGRGDPESTRAGLAALSGEWRALADRQRFATLEQLDDPDDLLLAIERWRSELAELGGAAIWPVLVIDALDSLDRLAALAELAERHGLIVLASADDSAIGRVHDRHLDLRLRLHPDEHALEIELAHVRLGPRARVRVGWDRGCGRFEAEREPS